MEEPAQAAVLRLVALIRLAATSHMGAVLAHPEGKALLPSAAAVPRRMGLKIGSRSSSVTKDCRIVGERKRSYEVTGCVGAGVAPVLSESSSLRLRKRRTRVLVCSPPLSVM